MTVENAETILLRSHVSQLAEHFDAVQVIVTRHDSERGGTFMLDNGAGNIYARMGAARAWLREIERPAKGE